MFCPKLLKRKLLVSFLFAQGNPDNRFSSSETKLLYTLHWIILDAASECEDADAESMALSDNKGSSSHMHSLSTIQLFVYLFAPLVHLMKVGQMIITPLKKKRKHFDISEIFNGISY